MLAMFNQISNGGILVVIVFLEQKLSPTTGGG